MPRFWRNLNDPCIKITFIGPLFLMLMGFLLGYIFHVVFTFDSQFLIIAAVGIIISLAFEGRLGFYILAVFVLMLFDIIFYSYPSIVLIDLMGMINAAKSFFSNLIQTIPPLFIGGAIGRGIRDLHYHFIGCPMRGLDHNVVRV